MWADSHYWQWAEAMNKKLQDNDRLLLLITGFENGYDSARQELAGELRRLLETHPFQRVAWMKRSGIRGYFNKSGVEQNPDRPDERVAST